MLTAKKPVYTVGQVNHYIRGMFTQDILLNSICVRGEVSNCKYHSSGHIYFSLKDESSTLSCVMWRSHRKGLAFPMKDGDKVIAAGSVNFYEGSGSCQLYASEIVLEGAGILYERFLALKKELEEMGMFSPLYKKKIPKYARRIGIITAPTGAAVRDIQNISHRRNPYVELILYPALVQGREAPQSLVKGLELMDSQGLDVIIIGRGGGSLEDLWAFNEEAVARAVFECRTPVISAVGHETDTTIVDFTADLRAPTPSAAAELAVFDFREFQKDLGNRRMKLCQLLKQRITLYRSRAAACQYRLNFLNPLTRLNQQRQKALDYEEILKKEMSEKLLETKEHYEKDSQRLRNSFDGKIQMRRLRFSLLLERFKGLNPLNRLKAGYAYVELPDSGALSSVLQLKGHDELTIHVTDGKVKAQVTEIERTG